MKKMMVVGARDRYPWWIIRRLHDDKLEIWN
jgi:hypothetical protein